MRALLTGHTHGLGAALADTLLQRGIQVLALSRGQTPQRAGLTQVSMDLADSAALVAWLAGDSLRDFLSGAGQVLLINNAGTLGPVKPPGRQSATALAQAVALNVAAPLMLTDALISASPAAHDRRIAHVSSGAARTPYAGWSVYCATKAALDQHARAASLDAPAGCRIVSVAPGVIDTAMQARIRATPDSDFPNRARFEALQRDGSLSAPAEAAARFIDHLLSARFGDEAVVDLRALRS